MQLEPKFHHKAWRLKDADPDKVFFWSDLHLRHDRAFLWGPRGFDSVQQHDTAIAQAWDTTIPADAIVFLLGDLVFGNDKLEFVKPWLDARPWKELVMLPGNHDGGYAELAEEAEYVPAFTNIGDRPLSLAPNILELRLSKRKQLVLSHYPLLSFNGQGRGVVHLHGHCHGTLDKTPEGSELHSGRVLEMSAFHNTLTQTPVSLRKVLQLTNAIKPRGYDHHADDIKDDEPEPPTAE